MDAHESCKSDFTEIGKKVSVRQLQVLQLVASGLSNKEIAREAGISHETVKKHTAAIRRQLNLRNSRELLAYAHACGCVVSPFRAGREERLALLTQRECEVARLLGLGERTKVVARKLGISPATVAKHRENLLAKLQLRSSLQLAAFLRD